MVKKKEYVLTLASYNVTQTVKIDLTEAELDLMNDINKSLTDQNASIILSVDKSLSEKQREQYRFRLRNINSFEDLEVSQKRTLNALYNNFDSFDELVEYVYSHTPDELFKYMRGIGEDNALSIHDQIVSRAE